MAMDPSVPSSENDRRLAEGHSFQESRGRTPKGHRRGCGRGRPGAGTREARGRCPKASAVFTCAGLELCAVVCALLSASSIKSLRNTFWLGHVSHAHRKAVLQLVESTLKATPSCKDHLVPHRSHP